MITVNDSINIHKYKRVRQQAVEHVAANEGTIIESRGLVLPKEALMCNGSCEKGCVEAIDRYYNNIVQHLITASNSCIPIKNSKYKKTLVE